MRSFWRDLLDLFKKTESILEFCNSISESVYITLGSSFFNRLLKGISLDEMPKDTKIKRSLLDYLVKENLEKTKKMSLDKFHKILVLYLNSDNDKNIPFDWLVSFVMPGDDQKNARKLIFNINQADSQSDKNNLVKKELDQTEMVSDAENKELNIFYRLLLLIKYFFKVLKSFFVGNKADKQKQIQKPNNKCDIRTKKSILNSVDHEQNFSSQKVIPNMVDDKKSEKCIRA